MLDVPGLQHAASLGVAVGGDHHALMIGPLDGWLVMSIVHNCINVLSVFDYLVFIHTRPLA